MHNKTLLLSILCCLSLLSRECIGTAPYPWLDNWGNPSFTTTDRSQSTRQYLTRTKYYNSKSTAEGKTAKQLTLQHNVQDVLGGLDPDHPKFALPYNKLKNNTDYETWDVSPLKVFEYCCPYSDICAPHSWIAF